MVYKYAARPSYPRIGNTYSMSHPCLYHDVSHLHTFDDKTVRRLSGVQRRKVEE